MAEIAEKPLAERILAAAVRPGLEPVLGTFAAAGEVVPAAQAFGRQRIAFGQSEVDPAARAVDLRERRLADVPQQVFGIDEVVARIDVAVVLDHERIAARLAHRADARLHAAPLGQRGVEELHEALPHVADDPLVENVAQKRPVALGRHRPFGRPRPLRLRRNDQRTVQPRAIDDMLHGGQKLHVAASDRIAEEAVDLRAAPLAGPVHDAQRIVLHARPPEHPDRPHHAREGGAPALRPAERVVNVLRPVERQPHQEAVFGEKLAPRLVHQRPVGLQRVLDPLARGVFPLERHGPAVEVPAEQQRLAAVPTEGHHGNLVGLDVLPDVELQQVVRHHRLPAAILCGLVEVVAIAAIEVAGRTGRLEHRRERYGARLFLRIAESENILVLHRPDEFTAQR